MRDGWIKLHREILGKAIWKCSRPAQKSILITILLMANWEENQWTWKGKKYHCKPGEFITSLKSLSDESQTSVRSVRTALSNFRDTYHFLTYESTNVSTKITVLNWEKYQLNDGECRQGDGQSTDKVPTTIKNYKNINSFPSGFSFSFDKPVAIPEELSLLYDSDISFYPKEFVDWARKKYQWTDERIVYTFERFITWHEENSDLKKGKYKNWYRRWQDFCRTNDKWGQAGLNAVNSPPPAKKRKTYTTADLGKEWHVK